MWYYAQPWVHECGDQANRAPRTTSHQTAHGHAVTSRVYCAFKSTFDSLSPTAPRLAIGTWFLTSIRVTEASDPIFRISLIFMILLRARVKPECNPNLKQTSSHLNIPVPILTPILVLPLLTLTLVLTVRTRFNPQRLQLSHKLPRMFSQRQIRMILCHM